MSAAPDATPDTTTGTPCPHLRLDGFEGPLDLLLDLARSQKVDLERISIVALVDQFLAVLEQARRVRLELAADWLVMAAWLAWLKSRLLVPGDAGQEAAPDEDAGALAGSLAARLAELARMRDAVRWLAARDQLGHEVFARGAPESLRAIDRSGLRADLPALLQAYAAARRRALTAHRYTPPRQKLWTVQEAVARLGRLLGAAPGRGMPPWATLLHFLPAGLAAPLADPLAHRAALASTLVAALEAARGGCLELRQDHAFGPILLRLRVAEAASARAA